MTVRVVATMVVRDEVDLIAANLDHLLHQGVCHVLVTDNGSRDGTRQVLGWYERHRPVSVIDEPVGAFWQGAWVTRMARSGVVDHGADWLVHVDADEFLMHPEMALQEYLGTIDQETHVLSIDRRDYVAVDDAAGDVAPITQVVHKAESLNLYGDRLANKVAHRADPDVTVAQGNHSVDGPLLMGKPQGSELVMHHYPARSLAQAERKITNLSDGYVESGLWTEGFGSVSLYWRKMLDDGTFDDNFRSTYARSRAEVVEGLASGSLLDDTSVREAVSEARGSARVHGGSVMGPRVEGWLASAPAAGAAPHGIDLLRDASHERRRHMIVFQMQTKEMIRDIRGLVDGPIVIMKGIEVAQLYPDSWCRDFVDVDLLVSDVDAADATLRHAGFSAFQAVSSLPDYHQTAPLVRPGNPVTVELHRRPSSPHWAHFPADDIVAHARPSRTGLDGLLRPRDDHHAVLMAWHYWRDGAHRARDLVDLHLLRQQTTDDAMEATAQSWGVGRIWGQTRRLLDALEDAPATWGRVPRRILDLRPVTLRERRLRQWWGISAGGWGAVAEVRERNRRRRQRVAWG